MRNKIRALSGVAGIALIIAIGAIGGPGANASHLTAVGLGTADSFAVLAGSGITNTGPTTITGDVGSHPTTTQTGFGSVTLNGTNHGGDAVTQGAKTDLVTAYNDAAGRSGAVPIAGGELGGRTLTHGVYTDDNAPDSLAITGTLTLDAEGDPNAVFIFQSGSTLTTAAGNSTVVLANGAQSCNVFWQVTSSATLGTNTTFKGTILALTSITVTTGAVVDGRVLARNGAVTMDTNTITRETCAGTPTPTPTNAPDAPTAAPTATPTATPSPTATPTATPGPTEEAAPTATATPAPAAAPVGKLPSTSTGVPSALLALLVVLLAASTLLVVRSPDRKS